MKVTDNMTQEKHVNEQPGAKRWTLRDATAQGGSPVWQKAFCLRVNYHLLTVCNSAQQSCLCLDESGWSALSGQARLIKLRLRRVHSGLQPDTRRNLNTDKWIHSLCIHSSLVCNWLIHRLISWKQKNILNACCILEQSHDSLTALALV